MARQTITTKAEVLEDLRVVLYVLIEQLNRIYGGANELALINRKTAGVVTRFSESAETGSANLDLSGMEITTYMSMIYDYAVDGRLDTQLSDAWEIVDEDILGFFKGLDHFPLISNNADDFPLASCKQVLNLLDARRALDYASWVYGEDYDIAQNCLQLKDVAVLAGIDEKTARNLAHPKAKNRLETTNWKGRTLVEKSFALEWLKKRGFKETVEYDSMLDRDLSKIGFWSLSALGDFVRRHRERLELNMEELVQKGRLGTNRLHWLRALEEGNGRFDQEGLTELAKLLHIPSKPFLLAALKVIQEAEVARLEANFSESDL